MANRSLKNDDVKAAMQLYRELAAATFFRGQTGYGLVVDNGVEKVGEISSSSEIWKPMYFFITGGEKHGRRTITAEDIKKAVEIFAGNELWALLRVTTGKGLRLNNTMPELVDIQQAEAGINFELTHFGGRSIVPKLELELSRVLDPAIKWRSGFLYQSQGDKPLAMGQNLVLARVLGKEEFETPENFGRVWQDVEKEAKRLMFLHCDSVSLPRSNGQSGDDRARAFLSQELTRLMPSVHIDGQKPGFEYATRRDGTVMVQKSIRQSDHETPERFAEAMKAYVTECFRVYTLFCQPLTDDQKKRLGRPDDEVNGLIQAEDGELERDERRSTETNEQLISWVDRAPGFPFEGWQPEKDKEYFMFQHAWGRGYRLSPGIPRYEERITGKDEKTALRQTVRIEYDDTEKVIKEEPVTLQSENRLEQSSWSSEFLTCVGQTVTIHQTRQIWTGIYRQVVESNYNGGNTIEWRRAEKLADHQETREFSVAVSGVGAKKKDSWYETKPTDLDLSAYNWIVKTQGKNPDGDEYSNSFSLDWGKLSPEIQTDQETTYPVCYCGSFRHSATEAECENCQVRGNCQYCGQTDAYMGKEKAQELICTDCRHSRKVVQEVLAGQGDRWASVIHFAQEIAAGKQGPRDREVTTSTGVYHLNSKYTMGTLELLADFGNKSFKIQAEIIDKIFSEMSFGGKDYSQNIILAEFWQESETSLLRFQPELEKIRQQWNATPGQGNPEGKKSESVGGKQAHWDESYAKDFLLVEYGTPYNQLGNSTSRHAKLCRAEAVITGNWEAIQEQSISAPGIDWLKEKWNTSLPEGLLETFRAAPDFEADLKVLALEEARLRNLAFAEKARFENKRLEDFWTFLGRGREDSGEIVEEIQDEQNVYLEESVFDVEPELTPPIASIWTLVSDPQMAKKGWFICPKGHTERIKNAQSGQMYNCDICGRGYAIA